MNRDKLFCLKKSELNVLNVLWKENEPLMASEIVKKGSLIYSTVQLALRDLMRNDIINVIDVVLNVTALSRKYVPTITKIEYENLLLANNFKKIVDVTKQNPSFVMALINQSDIDSASAEIEALQTLVSEYKAALELKKNSD